VLQGEGVREEGGEWPPPLVKSANTALGILVMLLIGNKYNPPFSYTGSRWDVSL